MKFKPIILTALLILIPIVSSAQTSTYSQKLFLEDRISEAVHLKKQFFARFDLNADSISIEKLSNTIPEESLKLLESNPDFDNAWYFLLKSYLSKNSNQESTFFLNKALAISEDDPAMLWLLYLEFFRSNEELWKDKTLELFQKALFKTGANSSRYISQILFQLGMDCEKSNNKSEANKLYQWAITLSPDKTLYWDRFIWVDFPSEPIRFIKKILQYSSSLAQSWQLQVHLIIQLFNWIDRAAIIILIIVITIYGFRYFPYALHPLSDLFPRRLPSTLRIILITAIIVSFISFGLLPFIWICTFTIWKYLSKKEKRFFTLVLITLILAPLFTLIQAALEASISPVGPLTNYYNIVNEDYSESICKASFEQQAKNSSDYLASLTPSICKIKSRNYNQASTYLQKLLSEQPEDPLALTVYGNLNFILGNLNDAENAYKKALSKDRNAVILFNLSQCYLKKLNTIEASELMNEAAKADPQINSFVNQNDLYFSKNWPMMRQILFPEISNIRFWTEFFPKYSLTNYNASALWGNTFFGLSPVLSFVFMLVLLSVLLLALNQRQSDKRIKKLFECRFCGKVICRKCKSGVLCHSCHNSTQFISNEKSMDNMHTIIQNRSRAIQVIKTSIIDILFPGAGNLLESEYSFLQSLPLIFLTGFVYSSYYYIFINLSDNLKAHSFELILFLLPLLTYNIFSVSKRTGRSIKELRIFLENKSSITQ